MADAAEGVGQVEGSAVLRGERKCHTPRDYVGCGTHCCVCVALFVWCGVGGRGCSTARPGRGMGSAQCHLQASSDRLIVLVLCFKACRVLEIAS